MGALYFLLIVGAAIVAPIVGFVFGRVSDILGDKVHDLVILLVAAAIAIAPLLLVLLGQLPPVCHRVHGLIWLFAFFAGTHLSGKCPPRVST